MPTPRASCTSCCPPDRWLAALTSATSSARARRCSWAGRRMSSSRPRGPRAQPSSGRRNKTGPVRLDDHARVTVASVIVHHTERLHRGVHRRGAEEREASATQLLRDGLGLRCGCGKVGDCGWSMLARRTVLPHHRGERCAQIARPQRRACVGDGRVDRRPYRTCSPRCHRGRMVSDHPFRRFVTKVEGTAGSAG